MVSFPTLLAAVMLLWRDDLRVGRPKVAVAQTLFVGLGNATPQHAAGGFAAATQRIRHDLPGSTAQGQPQPLLVFAPKDK